MPDSPLFVVVLLNAERRLNKFKVHQTRSIAQKARHAKADIRAMAERMQREAA